MMRQRITHNQNYVGHVSMPVISLAGLVVEDWIKPFIAPKHSGLNSIQLIPAMKPAWNYLSSGFSSFSHRITVIIKFMNLRLIH